jgi:hypothetical protein
MRATHGGVSNNLHTDYGKRFCMKRFRTIAAPLVCTIGLACLPLQQPCAQTKHSPGQSSNEVQPTHTRPEEGWQAKIKQELPLLGHRNWILIVDSAYPLQTSHGIETIETGATLPEVTQEVLRDLDGSIHVRPIVYMDSELPYLTDDDAAGVTRYQHEIHTVLGNRPVNRLIHEQLLRKIDEAGGMFDILVLKTTLTIPYTSVFLQLDCKYWSAASEDKLREKMKVSDR